MKILAVDDDEIFRELLGQALRSLGFEDLTLAAAPSEALKKIKDADTPFDCFFLDLQMPEMDGIELCRRIRAIRPYATVPILMITSVTEKAQVERAFAAGATDYLTKPIDFLELATRARLADQMGRQVKQLERFESLEKSQHFLRSSWFASQSSMF